MRLGGSALALTLLLVWLPVGDLWAAMRRVSPATWILVLAGCLSAHVVATIKWRMMVNLAGAGLRAAQAAHCYFAGLFGNVFLPSVVGGDVIRAGLGLRLGRNKPGVLLGSLLDRMLDVVALTGVAGLGALLLPRALDAQSRRVFWLLAACLVAAGAAALGVLAILPRRKFSVKMRRRLVKVRQALRSTVRQPQYVLLALTLGVTIQISFVALNAILGAACGLEVPLYVWMFAWPLAKISAMLPVTQGGIGVREIALAALLAPFGAPAVQSVAVGLVWETIVIANGLAGGLISLLAGRAAGALGAAGGIPGAAKQESPTSQGEAVIPRY